MQVNHGGGNAGMAKQFLECNNIESLFQQMCGVGMPQRMKTNHFGDGSFFERFAHHPRKPFHAVPSIRFLAVKQPDVRVLSCKVFFQSDCHAVGQWDNTVLLVFALADVNSFSFKVNI